MGELAERLAVWTAGTAAVVVVTVGALLGSHLAGTLSAALPAIGTAAAGLLFGYLWLLLLVAFGFVDAFDRTAGTGRTALSGVAAGAVVAVVYLTVVLVVGFVSPTPSPVAPGFAAVAAAIGVGLGVGGVLGGVVAGLVNGCVSLGAAVAANCDGPG